MSNQPLRTSELLTHTTVRIEADLGNSTSSTGTGFQFSFRIDENTAIPAIITNKHVIKNAKFIKFMLSESDQNGIRLNSKKMELGITEEQIPNRIILHPENDVDLCAILIGPILNKIKQQGGNPYLQSLEKNSIPNTQQWNDLSTLEEVIMIGYPNGIWDTKNNLPIIRKGITATHPKLDYNDKAEFLIDAAVFPGSSGSPVFIYNEGSFSTPNGIALGTRMMLIGITYGAYEYKVSGDIVLENIPTTQKPMSVSGIPNNLGLVIKSTKILDFEPSIKKLI